MIAGYVPNLDEAQIREACRHTHPFWGRGRTLEQHTERALAQMRAAGPALLRYVGWVSGTGELLCSLRRYSVQLAVPSQQGTRIVRTVGIGSVFTAEPHRRQGAARRLVEAVMEEGRGLGDEAALLYSDITPAFYARLGFVEFPALDFSAPAGDLPVGGALAVRPASAGDTERLLAWFEASYPPAMLRPARDAAVWSFFRRRNTERPDLILSDGGVDAGYLHAVPAGDTLWVEEWAAPELEPARLWATLRQLATGAGAKQIGGWLRPDQVDGRFHLTHRTAAIPMAADLTGTLGLSSLDPERSHFWSMDHF